MLPASGFNRNRSRKDGRASYCRGCERTHTRAYYRKNRVAFIAMIGRRNKALRLKRRQMLDALKKIPCADCRGRFNPWQMDFDHVRGKKCGEVARIANRGWSVARLNKEIKKCDIVCSNCHRQRTHDRRLKKRKKKTIRW